MKIYHNPRCSKSREALSILQDQNTDFEIVEYLQHTPTEDELKELLRKLDKKPKEIIRKGEAIFKEKYQGKSFSDAEWIQIMVENPKLIERPIVVRGDKAVLGRPPENVLKLF